VPSVKSDLPLLPQIYYIRHGETAWSESGQHTGITEIPLDAEGEAKARQLEQTLRGIRFDRVWVSPRQRAQRTYELSGVPVLAEVEPDLAEWDYGDYEGITSGDIKQDRPDWNLFLHGCPNGESIEAVGARADRLIDRLKALPGKTALFGHGHFGRVLGARWVGYPVSAGQRLLLSTASVSVLSFEHHAADEPTLTLWNLPSGDELTR
jgi:broad specificity phosphatase PhoE